jgi:hypothetical protein
LRRLWGNCCGGLSSAVASRAGLRGRALGLVYGAFKQFLNNPVVNTAAVSKSAAGQNLVLTKRAELTPSKAVLTAVVKETLGHPFLSV